MRARASLALKIIVTASALIGVFISFFTAKLDGYSPWWVRLLYFTTQSNLWIGVTMLLLLVDKVIKESPVRRDTLYLLKFIFTVSITVTGLVYCIVLAPFADESYRPWSFTSILTHVVVPVASVVDFFVDERQKPVTFKQVPLATIPPLYYIFFAGVLGSLGVDFGRGENYPYFFMNYWSPVGFFGVGGDPPNQIGSMYWIFIFFVLIALLASAYACFHPNNIKRRRNKNE